MSNSGVCLCIRPLIRQLVVLAQRFPLVACAYSAGNVDLPLLQVVPEGLKSAVQSLLSRFSVSVRHPRVEIECTNSVTDNCKLLTHGSMIEKPIGPEGDSR